MIRALILLTFLASLGWWLDREHRVGRFQRVDELFLDLLVANTRDRFEKAEAATGSASPVVFVKMRTADKAEYAGWPPRPLDWQMVLKGLQTYDPAVIVIPETLTWGNPSPEFTQEAANALVPFPSTILGTEGQLASVPNAPAFLGGLEDILPRFEKISGEIKNVPPLGALIAAPDELLRRQAELGITITRQDKDKTLMPYAVQEDGHLRPTALTQALVRWSGTPYFTHRLLLGPGAGAYLANGAFVPLSTAGEFTVDTKQTVSEVDALNVMTVELAEALTDADKKHLHDATIIVIGTDDAATGGLARMHAQALARVLAMPRIQVLPDFAQWIVWAMAALTGFWLVLFVPKQKALLRGALLILAGLGICFLAFQFALIWCPPTLPAALLAASTLFARVLGRVKAK
jgi:hypothetical protein